MTYPLDAETADILRSALAAEGTTLASIRKTLIDVGIVVPKRHLEALLLGTDPEPLVGVDAAMAIAVSLGLKPKLTISPMNGHDALAKERRKLDAEERDAERLADKRRSGGKAKR
jgi:hypothetical protein